MNRGLPLKRLPPNPPAKPLEMAMGERGAAFQRFLKVGKLFPQKSFQRPPVLSYPMQQMEWRADESGIAFGKASPEPPCETLEMGKGMVVRVNEGQCNERIEPNICFRVALSQDDFLRRSVENLPIFQ